MTDLLDAVKNLREITGAGFLDCKKALSENNNDLEASIDFLRKKGLSKASKKSSREAKEGVVAIYSNSSQTIILKVNSETDFAAKSETFLNFVDKIGNFALSLDKKEGLNDFLDKEYEGKKITDHFKEIISVIGENILLKEIILAEHNGLHNNYYVHNSYKSNIGKIISFVSYESSNLDESVKQFTKNICMHIAASKPEALDVEFLDDEYIEKEKNFQIENIKSSGKPENIIEKILEGKMKKFYAESTLLNQMFILDTDKTVKNVIDELPNTYEFKLIDYKLLALT